MERPGDVDLALIMLPAARCVEAAEDIVARKKSKGDIGAVIVGSAGFRELGTAEGRQREAVFLGILGDHAIRVIDPNCVGIVDTYSGVNTPFSVPPDTRKGGLSIISQSGALAASYLCIRSRLPVEYLPYLLPSYPFFLVQTGMVFIVICLARI